MTFQDNDILLFGVIDIIKRHNPDVSLDCTTPKYRKKFNLFFIDLQ